MIKTARLRYITLRTVVGEKAPGSTPAPTFCSFYASPSACVELFQLIQFPPTAPNHEVGWSKLTTVRCVCVEEW